MWLQRCETTLVESMQRIADGLFGAAQIVGSGGGHLALGTGERDLAAAHGKARRRPETGLQGGLLVRHERVDIYRCLHVYTYTTCSKTFIGMARST